MPYCPNCRKPTMIYVPWLGQMWSCQSCGYQGPIVIEIKRRAMQDLLKQIPKGKVTTYKILAEQLGLHQRAVSGMLRTNNATKAPCYKVISSDGKLGGYSATGGVKQKIALLRKDGIKIEKGKVDLEKYLHRF